MLTLSCAFEWIVQVVIRQLIPRAEAPSHIWETVQASGTFVGPRGGVVSPNNNGYQMAPQTWTARTGAR